MIIYIRDLIIKAKHGFHDYEKVRSQRFKINIELTVKNDQAAISDKLEDTINWSEVRDEVIKVTEGSSFDLIERLAKEIADQLLTNKKIEKVVVAIDKLDAFPGGVPGIRLEATN